MKQLVFLFLFAILCHGAARSSEHLIEFVPGGPGISMRPYFSILEEDVSFFSPTMLIAKPRLFVPIQHYNPHKKSNIFWLSTSIRSNTAANAVISFQHLTMADLYIMADTAGSMPIHHRAGGFRPAGQILPGDGRFHFQLHLDAGIVYRVLIRSHHTKQYHPIFDFELNDLNTFTQSRQQREMVNYWFQGGVISLLLYVLISWLNTRYRSYLWLAIFISGFILYNLALDRYFIDWFFSENPDVGWRFIIHFLHLALAGLYLLILDFWQVKHKNLLLYQTGKIILFAIAMLSVLSFSIHYFTSNFRLMSQVNGLFIIVQVSYLVGLLCLWKKLDRHQRFLGYGVVFYLMMGLFATLGLFILGETMFSTFTILSGSIVVTVSLLFLIGINGKLWQHEKDKNIYLAQLSQLQQEQNLLLEQNVMERTQELNTRNERIALLMNELNHRVKNNLQLLYSLNSLQLAGSRNRYASNTLKDNVARIKAMMLVNDRLNPDNNAGSHSIAPAAFISDIAAHTRKMFIHPTPVDIKLNIHSNLVLDTNAGLCLGLIVTELITNSCKHAFAAQSAPQIQIDILQAASAWEMHYRDNGTGIGNTPAGTFGLGLIADLTRQLKGHYHLQSDSGTYYLFKFPNRS